mmetsp:Transcript_25438/g.28302  ORF Transcript_25438/g.28302 Transcript_25438/m.28302 type:complete len:509 (-) Transcript_25438:72-1598(-)
MSETSASEQDSMSKQTDDIELESYTEADPTPVAPTSSVNPPAAVNNAKVPLRSSSHLCHRCYLPGFIVVAWLLIPLMLAVPLGSAWTRIEAEYPNGTCHIVFTALTAHRGFEPDSLDNFSIADPAAYSTCTTVESIWISNLSHQEHGNWSNLLIVGRTASAFIYMGLLCGLVWWTLIMTYWRPTKTDKEPSINKTQSVLTLISMLLAVILPLIGLAIYRFAAFDTIPATPLSHFLGMDPNVATSIKISVMSSSWIAGTIFLLILAGLPVGFTLWKTTRYKSFGENKSQCCGLREIDAAFYKPYTKTMKLIAFFKQTSSFFFSALLLGTFYVIDWKIPNGCCEATCDITRGYFVGPSCFLDFPGYGSIVTLVAAAAFLRMFVIPSLITLAIFNWRITLPRGNLYKSWLMLNKDVSQRWLNWISVADLILKVLQFILVGALIGITNNHKSNTTCSLPNATSAESAACVSDTKLVMDLFGKDLIISLMVVLFDILLSACFEVADWAVHREQ